MVQAAQKLDEVLRAPAEPAFAAMSQAHTKMVDAIQDKNATLPEAIAAMNDFAAKMTRLKEIYDAFETAGT